MARQIFITATDTGAGKTYFTTQLIQALLKQGISARAIKPIASGIQANGINEDVDILQQSQHIENPNDINLYSFAQPTSPNIAAKAENKHIEPHKLIHWCQKQAQTSDICIIEGVGGLMAPLTDNYLVSDWITDLPNAEIVLVVGVRLGCINHMLLTLEKLKTMGRNPTWVVFNQGPDSDAPSDLIQTLLNHVPKESTVIQLATNDQNMDLSLLSF